jgi:uncharacterized protein
MRYGQRVRVVTIQAPAIMRSPKALEVFGPRAFRLDVDYASPAADKPVR